MHILISYLLPLSTVRKSISDTCVCVNVGVDVDDTHASVSSVVDVSSIMIRHIIL